MAPNILEKDSSQSNWMVSRKNKRSHIGVSEDKKLELRLGLPGDTHDLHEDKKALLFQSEENDNNNNNNIKYVVGSLAFHSSPNNSLKQQPNPSSYVLSYNNSSSPSSSDQNNNPCSVHCNAAATTDDDRDSKFANNSSPPPPICCNKRTARAPVVGWPPVRSFRKNLASNNNNSSKTPPPVPSFGSDDDQKVVLKDDIGLKIENNGIKSEKIIIQDHMFVKINMEGVPIGRKVDLKAHDSYEKLSYAIDELFRGLLAAQRDYSASERTEETEAKTVSNGEYTLVYEDNEGDRMLVGDVPWKMFVSTAKRLRVLRTVELSTIKLTSSTQTEKTPLDSIIMRAGK